MIAFTPTGPIVTFTAASSAPTSQQATSTNNTQNQQYMLTNADTTNDAVIGWGTSDTIAKLAAAAGSTVTNCYYLLRGTQVVVTGPTGAFFSGIAVASTAAIKVQAGYGN